MPSQTFMYMGKHNIVSYDEWLAAQGALGTNESQRVESALFEGWHDYQHCIIASTEGTPIGVFVVWNDGDDSVVTLIIEDETTVDEMRRMRALCSDYKSDTITIESTTLPRTKVPEVTGDELLVIQSWYHENAKHYPADFATAEVDASCPVVDLEDGYFSHHVEKTTGLSVFYGVWEDKVVIYPNGAQVNLEDAGCVRGGISSSNLAMGSSEALMARLTQAGYGV